ncbi:hypothetical protein [Pseudomonas guariconensis]
METAFAIIGWALLAMAVVTAVCYWWHDDRGIAKQIAVFTVIAFLVLHYL